MTLLLHCNRCSNAVGPDHATGNGWRKVTVNAYDPNSIEAITTKSVDLCKNCIKDFDKFTEQQARPE